MNETDGAEADINHPVAASISAIDKKSVHRICSGQVVLTLSTAVKELLENSIDAGATIIDIKLRDYGSELIEVSDNGEGVKESNFQGLTLKHHTSKLQEFTDLINVETFGFRGEALSSLCALSDMYITTRHKEASVGTKLEYDHNGKITKQTAQARQCGTTVSLQNLFYTLPVRHKEFQRNVKKEFIKMVQVLNSYCIISTGVRITCSNQTAKGNKSVVVSSKGNSTLQENIANVFGPKQMSSLKEFVQRAPGEDLCTEFSVKSTTTALFRLEGHVSKCDHGQGRSSTDRQFFYINGRPFDSNKLSKVVNEVYHQYNRHQYPFVALKICVQKDNVDVNVTPNKRQVYLDGERHLMATIKASLVAMYEPTTSVLQITLPVGIEASNRRSLPNQAGDHSRLSRHTSLEKPSGLSSLMKLKRSFSSAFAPDSPAQSPSNRNILKQRRLDCFVSPSSLTRRETDSTADTSKDCEIVDLTDNKIENTQDDDDDDDGDNKDDDENSVTSKQELIDTRPSAVHKDTCGLINDNTLCFESCDEVVCNVSQPNLTKLKYHEEDSESHVFDNDRLKSANPDCAAETDSKDTCTDMKLTEICTQDKSLTDVYKPQVAESCPGIKIVHHVPAIETDEKDTNLNIASSKEPSEKTYRTEQESWHDCDEIPQSHLNYRETDGIKPRLNLIPHSTTLETNDNHPIVDDIEAVEKKVRQVDFSLDTLKAKWRKTREEKEAAGGFSRAFRATINPTENMAAEQELQREIKKDMFSTMEILGQFNLGFIIAKLEKDLFIVDQHATDEKFNFETLQREHVIQSQKLICPMNLELTASSETILMDNLDIFTKNGFEFLVDEQGPPTQRVKLTSTPVSKNWNFGKEDIEEMIFMLSESPGVTCRPSRVRAMFASRACRKSIMIGTYLNKAQMKKLVSHMGEIEQPWNCPHGRPTMRHLINLDMVPR